MTRERAFRLADAAAHAPFINYKWLFHPYLLPCIIKHFDLPEFDGLVRSRAVLFADDAGDPLGIGQTAVFVKKDAADFRGMFFIQAKFCKGAGRAHLAAEGAVVFTVTCSGSQSG